jgi:isopentenyl diphosphate isomerase/L-lactate dehydrogenase-like FMN-dependent dehydrogenase
MIFDFIDGGAEDEVTAQANRAAFDAVHFAPSALVDVSKRDLTTTIAGCEASLPLVLAPAGLTRVVHRDGEVAVAKAAETYNVPFVITPFSTTTIEELAQSVRSPLWMEVNATPDPKLWETLTARASEAGYAALVFLADTPIGGRRERELRRKVIPPRYTPRNVVDAVQHPNWLYGFFQTAHLIAPRNLEGTDWPRRWWPKVGPIGEFGAKIGTPAGTWEDLKAVRRKWDRPLAVKGIITAADAIKSVDIGADVVILSNHGGRQLDGLPPTIEVLPEIVDAVGDRAEILVDGGVRRGTHIAKALALGARACLVGRPWHYGLGAAGQPGVERVIEMLSDEFSRTLALLGCTSVADLDQSRLRARP